MRAHEDEMSDEPKFEGIAKRKLDDLIAHGWSVDGYSISKDGQHGFVTTGAFVGWWLPEYYSNHTSGEPPIVTDEKTK